MKTLKEFNYNQDQKSLVSSIINHYGTGDHPYCDNLSIDFFTVKYLQEILINNYEQIKKNLTDKGKTVFDSILNLF